MVQKLSPDSAILATPVVSLFSGFAPKLYFDILNR
uniref:Predicted protein n=1 Tax=Hordeum vulgare subsp. vulgare TaxID=112509 RepID=F2EBU3_HORVV|nr:predicted protein [Hordeum vulgare subsp. vulgare]